VPASVEYVEDLGGDVTAASEDVAFPETEHCPAGLLEKRRVLSVALDVPSNLSHPVIRIVACAKLPTTLCPSPPVPEVTIAEHHKAGLGEHDIGTPWQVAHVDAVATSEPPEMAA